MSPAGRDHVRERRPGAVPEAPLRRSSFLFRLTRLLGFSEHRCPVCGTPVEDDGAGGSGPEAGMLAHGLCPACARALGPYVGGRCRACGLPLPWPAAGQPLLLEPAVERVPAVAVLAGSVALDQVCFQPEGAAGIFQGEAHIHGVAPLRQHHPQHPVSAEEDGGGIADPGVVTEHGKPQGVEQPIEAGVQLCAQPTLPPADDLVEQGLVVQG